MCFVLAASSDFVASYYISLGETLAKRLTNHVAGNFRWRKFRKLMENKIFTEKTTDCLLVPPKVATPPNFTKKTFPIVIKP